MVDVEVEPILKQIKFYFSDANLLRDKFLKQKISENNGWVTVKCLLTFNRLKKLTTDPQKVIDSLQQDTTNFFEINTEELKIRRNPTLPPPTLSFRKYLHEQRDKIYYIDNFPATYSIDEIEYFLNSHDVKAQFIKRLLNTDKSFTGTIYCVFDSVDDSVTKLSALELEGKPLIVKTLEQHVTTYPESDLEGSRKRKLNDAPSKKKKKYPTNALLRLCNVNAECKSKNIKDALSVFKTPSWVDRSDKDFMVVQFTQDNDAIEVMKHLMESEGKLKVDQYEIVVELISDEKERLYWGILVAK